MFCSHCNTNLAGMNGTFCPHCGTQVAAQHNPHGSHNSYGPQNPHGPYGGLYNPNDPSRMPDNSSKATASLVLGLCGLIAWFLPIIGFPVTITGLVLGIKGLKSYKRDRATAGVVLTILGLVATIVNSAIGAYMGAIGVLF